MTLGLNALAVPNGISSYSAATRELKKTIPVQFNHAGQAQASFTYIVVAEEDTFLVCEEAEDEDGTDASPRKYKSPAGTNAVPANFAHLYAQQASAKPVAVLWQPATGRYILLRNLRI